MTSFPEGVPEGPAPATRLITDRAERLAALQAIRPARIAVAYLGDGWDKLIGGRQVLKELVVAPEPGTNAAAVLKVAKKIGWANVHLLDELHAKLYIGEAAAMFGSANLSKNAFAAGGREQWELVSVTDDSALLERLETEFARYRQLASDLYRTSADKEKRIRELLAVKPLLDKAQVRLSKRPPAPTLDQFKVGSRTIHLEWWEGYSGTGEADDYDHLDLRLPEDGTSEVDVGHWVLEWRCDKSGRPARNFSLDWMRIDVVRRNRNPGETFSDQVAQRQAHPPHAEPFQIDDRLKKVFKQLIRERDDLRPDDTDAEVYPLPLGEVNDFLKVLKKRYIAAL